MKLKQKKAATAWRRSRRQLVGQSEGRKKQNVLGPLVNADRLDRVRAVGALIQKSAGDRECASGASAEAQAQGGIGQHGLARVGQQRQVGAGVADVVECAEAVLEKR